MDSYTENRAQGNIELISPTHLDTPITTKSQQLATGLVPKNRSLRGSKVLKEELDLLLQEANLSEAPTKWDPTSIFPILVGGRPSIGMRHSDSKTQMFLSGGLLNAQLQSLAFLGPNPDLDKITWSSLDPKRQSQIKDKAQIKDFWEGVVRLSGCKTRT